MKKLLLLALMMVGISASAQVVYQPSFFSPGYVVDGQYVGHTQFKAKLLENRASYDLWNKGTSNLTGGYISLYTGSALLGWGIGTNLGESINDAYGVSTGADGTVFIVAGGVGIVGGLLLMKKGQEQREMALFRYNKGKNKVGWKPISNKRGAGIAITLD